MAFGAKNNKNTSKANTNASAQGGNDLMGVENWYGKCFSVKQPNDNLVILNCQCGSRKRKDADGYINGINVSVMVSLGGDTPTKIEEDDYEGANILVSGRFQVGEYTDPKTKETKPQYTIWATEVTKREDNK